MRKFVAFAITGSLVATIVLQREAAAEDPCVAMDVEYALSGTLAIRDTRLGAGDGDHNVGPGTLVLRFDGAQPGPGPVKLVSYAMKSTFTVEAKALVWNTKVTTDTQTTASGSCSAAEGTLAKTRLSWASKVRNYKTEGTLTCDGSMCGKFGAPPQGKSDYKPPTTDVTFASFDMSPDFKTFTMAASQVSKSESPAQTTYLTIAGRETKRTCLHTKPCP
jgi:hypothetical protein